MPSTYPFDMVVFGGNGDLAMRKLLPALYYCHKNGQLHDDGRIIGVARSITDRDAYLQLVEEHCRRFIAAEDLTPELWAGFMARLDCVQLDAAAGDYQALHEWLGDDPGRVRVFYLATAPALFKVISQHLAGTGLITPAARVVLEKPLGKDLASAQEINRQVGAVFAEHQIFRIDHYLGKETVQNLMVLRFGNVLFEPLWRSSWISHVEITAAEKIGVEGRGGYYDTAGAMRDMVQNHLLQLLCILAMEPPNSTDPDAVRDEKLKVLRALEPYNEHAALNQAVRGQYRAGAIDGKAVPGYLEESNIAPDSRTETFVALRAELATWRWAGVPFYLRTGKRLPERLSEIIVHFRRIPHSIFEDSSGVAAPNRLVIQLQPDETVKLYLMAKAPGDDVRLRPVNLNLNFAETFKTRRGDAYERLLIDVILGKLTLFMRGDELEAAWRWAEPILDAWQNSDERPKGYTAGSWGPTASSVLIGREGFNWHEESD